jgi:metal-dependent amidase/aminoacylase/carboxypeptidase family protein
LAGGERGAQAPATGLTPGTTVAEVHDKQRKFDIVVRGKSGHAAYPHTTVDPVVMAAHFILELQSLVSRETNPTQPAVITVGFDPYIGFYHWLRGRPGPAGPLSGECL